MPPLGIRDQGCVPLSRRIRGYLALVCKACRSTPGPTFALGLGRLHLCLEPLHDAGRRSRSIRIGQTPVVEVAGHNGDHPTHLEPHPLRSVLHCSGRVVWNLARLGGWARGWRQRRARRRTCDWSVLGAYRSRTRRSPGPCSRGCRETSRCSHGPRPRLPGGREWSERGSGRPRSGPAPLGRTARHYPERRHERRGWP
jgi:hypothetical protein